MRKVYTSFILLFIMLFGAMSIAQEQQKSYINYQGVARKADGTLMAGESLTIGIGLKFGSASSETLYEESHNLIADTSGVFSLKIGNGNAISGIYDDLPWGSFATFASVSMNGGEIGTTELMAVPYALSSADNQWHIMGDDIENKNGGNVFVTGSLYASRDLSLASGAAVNEFSADITLGSNSDEIVPTQKAVKTYVDSQIGGSGGGADDQTAAEVAYDNSTSGLTATTAQTAIDELVTGGSVDADADPNNEIQTLSFNAVTSELSLTDGGAVTIPSGVTDADADPNNEIQDISLSGTELSISDGSTIDLAPIVPPGGTDDQNLILAGDVLSIEDGSGSVDLSTYRDDADADPTNEIDVTAETGILIGDGSTVTGLVGTADGQVAKWDNATSSWVAGTDETGGGGGSLWTDNGGDIYYSTGKVGIGTNSPESSLAIETDGNQWNLSATEGDFRIGDATHRLKMGVAIDGAGAGDARIRVEGGTDRMMLGGGTNDVLTITDQNVGIGTITPASKLHVDGDIRSDDLAGVGERNVVADASGNLIIGAGGGSSLWTDNGGDIHYTSGKVGVGTSSPDANFEVAGTGTVRHRMTSSNSSAVSLQWFLPGNAKTDWSFTSTDKRMEWGYSSSDFSGGTIHTRLLDDGTLDVIKGIRSGDLAGAGERNVVADANGNFIIGADGGGSLWLENGSNIYYNGGNVGIGTNNPSAPLEIKTAAGRPLLIESTSNNSYMQYATPSGSVGYSGVWSGDNDVDFGTTSINNIGKVHLTTKATPKLTVTANGNVGIGGTSPTARLHIFQKSQNVGTGLRFSDGTTNKDWDLTHGFGLMFHYGGEIRGFISANSGAYTQASDRRLKTNIMSLGPVLESVNQLRPTTYSYKADEKKKTTLGLIAQEVQPLFPELVSNTGEENMLGLDYGAFSIVAIKAIQEQQTIMDKQAEKISELEQRLLRLEEKLDK